MATLAIPYQHLGLRPLCQNSGCSLIQSILRIPERDVDG